MAKIIAFERSIEDAVDIYRGLKAHDLQLYFPYVRLSQARPGYLKKYGFRNFHWKWPEKLPYADLYFVGLGDGSLDEAGTWNMPKKRTCIVSGSAEMRREARKRDYMTAERDAREIGKVAGDLLKTVSHP